MIYQSLTTSFKKELLTALHNFSASGGNTFKIALYSSNATLDATTTAYTATGELTTGSGYTAGGATLTNVEPASSGLVGYTTFSSVSWASSSFTTRGALIYNSTNANRSVMTLDFGMNRTSTGTFRITFPTADSSNAIIRIAA